MWLSINQYVKTISLEEVGLLFVMLVPSGPGTKDVLSIWISWHKQSHDTTWSHTVMPEAIQQLYFAVSGGVLRQAELQIRHSIWFLKMTSARLHVPSIRFPESQRAVLCGRMGKMNKRQSFLTCSKELSQIKYILHVCWINLILGIKSFRVRSQWRERKIGKDKWFISKKRKWEVLYNSGRQD